MNVTNANSLPLVVNTCEMANPSQIFTPPCLLSQHVILALIQQLGRNNVNVQIVLGFTNLQGDTCKW